MADESPRQQTPPKPRTTRPRPESTVVQTFIDDLESMFGLTPEIEELEGTINSKKQVVSSGERELQELEARLRETEKRLARWSRPLTYQHIEHPEASGAADNDAEAGTERPRTSSKRQDAAHAAARLAGTSVPEAPRMAAGGTVGDYAMMNRAHNEPERGLV